MTICFELIVDTTLIAQTEKNVLGYQPESSMDLFSLFNNKAYFIELRVNDVSIKAMRDFVKSFKDVQNEKWYKISDGFISSFIKDGVQTKVVYDLKGTRHCVLSAFNENQMPADTRSEVKSAYPDYNIIVAYEIKFEMDSTYIVKIETPVSLKILQLYNGQIEVKGNYTK
jgi:hypothetical protein